MSSVRINRRVHKDLKKALEAAHAAGWAVISQGKDSAVLQSPDPNVEFRVPLGSSVPDEIARRLMEKVRQVAKSFEVSAVDIDGDPLTVRCEEHNLEFLHPPGLAHHIETVHRALEVMEGTAAEAPSESNIDHERRTLVTMEDVQESVEVVRPWHARIHRDATGKSGVYESPAVLEVSIDDEVVEYRCAKEGCAESSDSPHSIVAHYSWHVRRGEIPATDWSTREIVDRVDVSGKHITRQGREGLRSDTARAIYEALRSNSRGTRTNSKYANVLAQHIEAAGFTIVESTFLENGESGATALLEQIRALVGASPADEALNAALKVEVDMLRDALSEASARAEHAEGRWNALKDLMS